MTTDEKSVADCPNCVTCELCGGTGVWLVKFDGPYADPHHEMDEKRKCPHCLGDGIEDRCEACREL